MTSLHQQISSEHDDQRGLLYQARNDGLIELECKVKELSQSQAQCLLMESVLRISSLEETLRNKEKEHEKLSHSIDAEKENVDKMRQSLVQLQLDKQRKIHKSQKVQFLLFSSFKKTFSVIGTCKGNQSFIKSRDREHPISRASRER